MTEDTLLKLIELGKTVAELRAKSDALDAENKRLHEQNIELIKALKP